MATEIEVAWAAGIFEGEGCATLSYNGTVPRPLISVKMTDRDVVERFQQIVDCGRIYEYLYPSMVNRKTAWHWHTTRTSELVLIYNMFSDFLGIRRKARF